MDRPDFHRKLPQVPGVYFIVHEGNIIYVGKARSLQKRWGDHKKKEQAIELGQVRLHYLEIQRPEVFENLLIEAHDPPWNIHGRSTYQSQDERYCTKPPEGWLTLRQASALAGRTVSSLMYWSDFLQVDPSKTPRLVNLEKLKELMTTREYGSKSRLLPEDVPEGWMTLPQAAEYCGKSQSTIKLWETQLELDTTAQTHLIKKSSLDALLRERVERIEVLDRSRRQHNSELKRRPKRRLNPGSNPTSA